MPYQVIDENGYPLDAHLELDEHGIDFLARGGTREKGLNSDYGTGLRVLLERLVSSEIEVANIWVNSSRVQSISIEDRIILSANEFNSSPAEAFTLISERMRLVGQKKDAKGGNSTKKIRIEFATNINVALTAKNLGLNQTTKDLRSHKRLPGEQLKTVKPEHLFMALVELRRGNFHGYPDSTAFDVFINENERYPPKALFGIAATFSLGFSVKPKDFTGGKGSVCFNVLEKSGYEIVAKNENVNRKIETLNDNDRAWTEGRPRLVTHLKKERATGLARAKKSHFLSKHGKLFCENCGMDPEDFYKGVHGTACIEVHHKNTQVADMNEQHVTRLDDLQCLCANCHRVVHSILRDNEKSNID